MEILKVKLIVGYDKKDFWEEDITKDFKKGEFDCKDFITPTECGKIMVDFFNRTRNKGDKKRIFLGVEVWEGKK